MYRLPKLLISVADGASQRGCSSAVTIVDYLGPRVSTKTKFRWTDISPEDLSLSCLKRVMQPESIHTMFVAVDQMKMVGSQVVHRQIRLAVLPNSLRALNS